LKFRFNDINTRKYQEKNALYKNNPDYLLVPKIIMTFSGGKKPANLYARYFSKEIGVTDNTMYQIISKTDNKNNIITFLNSKLIHFILKITQYSAAPKYKNEFNIGLYGNWNKCLTLAKGKWITILNDDDLLENNFLTEVSCLILSDSRINIIGVKSKINYFENP
jgi:hypothetical protein